MATAPKWNDRITWRGVTLTRRTVRMLKWVEDKSGITINPTQGSYHPGYGPSAGSHDREAVDLHISDLSDAEVTKLDKWMKLAGFAGWHRKYVKGLWPEHYHAVPRGGDLSPLAAYQVTAFDKKRDGLKSNLSDPTFHPVPKRRWSWTLNRPIYTV